MKIIYPLENLTKTDKLATVLAEIAEPNLFMLLNGPLGAGKTQLTKLIGKALGVKDTIVSPTFVILNQYQTKFNWQLIHMDAYRLQKIVNFQIYYELMLDNVTIIEWADNLELNWNEQPIITINFVVDQDDKRTVMITTNNLSNNAEKKLKEYLEK